MVVIQNVLRGLSHINLSKGTTVFKGEVPMLKEIEMFTTSLKREAGDVVNVTHRVRQTGKSPYAIADIQVKDKSGNIIDRLFASLSDWNKNGQSYTVKFRKGSPKPQKSIDNNKPIDKNTLTKDKTISDKEHKPEKPFDNNKPIDKNTPTKDETITGKEHKPEKTIDNNKPIDKNTPTKDETITGKEYKTEKPIDNNKPVDKNTPKIPTAEDTSGGLVPHPTQHIPNVRDFEIEGLLNHDMETIVNMQKTGRQTFFDPMTGKPNVFWSADKQAAFEYFLKLLNRS